MRANEQQYGRVSIRTREVASSVHAMTENLLGLTVTARSRIAKAMDSEAANEIIEKATWPTDAVVAMPCPWRLPQLAFIAPPRCIVERLALEVFRQLLIWQV